MVLDFVVHVVEDYYMLRYLCMMIFRCEFYEIEIMHVLRKRRCSILSSFDLIELIA
jgi:hypothetical protein